MNQTVSTMFSERGKKLLVVNNFKFSKATTSKRGNIRWRCCIATCPARLFTHIFQEENIVEMKEQHNHRSDEKLARNAVSNSVKRKAAEEFGEKPSTIINRELHSNPYADCINADDINRIRKNLRAKRRTILPTVPKDP